MKINLWLHDPLVKPESNADIWSYDKKATNIIDAKSGNDDFRANSYSLYFELW